MSNATAWSRVRDAYDRAMASGDPRTEPWLLVRSPWPVAVLCLLYLALIRVGPRAMQGRAAWNLRLSLLAYNSMLVGLSVYMAYEFVVTSVSAGYSYLCQPVDYTNSELGQRMASVCWWFFFSKVIELLDTVFFILRKKFNQITFLHVYHHSSMIINWWLGVKYVPGGQAFFIGMVNSIVHIVMYTYYGLSALGPAVQKYLWWKRYLTMLQLTQFVIIALHTSYNLFTDCDFSDAFNTVVFLYIVSLIALFLNFYVQTYRKGKAKAP